MKGKKLTGRFLPNGLTPKQDKFARLYFEEGHASNAYRAAYNVENMTDKSVYEKSSELLANGKIAARLSELADRAAKRHDVTVDSLIAELEEAREKAEKDDKGAGAMVQATMGKGKLAGLIVDKQKVEGGSLEQRLLNLIKSLDEKAKAAPKAEPTEPEDKDTMPASPGLEERRPEGSA